MRRLTTERAAGLIVVLLLFAMASRVSVDPDMWWHIRLGEQSVLTGDSVYIDSFSHTQYGAVHKNHSWLGQVVMVGFWSLGGHLGMTLYVSALAVAGMAFVYFAGRGSIYMQGFALVLGGACAAAFWSPRPQMFTFLFTALLLYLLQKPKRDGRAPFWTLPLIMWLWANSHGGYIVGYLIIGAFLLGEWLNGRFRREQLAAAQIRRLCGFTVLSLALAPINPLGFDVFLAPFETFGISGMRDYIQEWKSPDFTQPVAWSFVILVVAFLVGGWTSRLRIGYGELLLAGGAFVMALYSARHLSLFAIAAVPVITTSFDTVLRRKGWTIADREEETPKRLALNAALIAAVALGTFARVAYVSSPDTVDQSLALNYPAAAVDFLKASGLEGNLFNSYNWGGYLIFALPEYPVFIDGRTDLHRDALGEYTAAAFGTSVFPEVFARHNIAVVLIESDGPLALRLDADKSWERVYRDRVASVYAPLAAQTGDNDS